MYLQFYSLGEVDLYWGQSALFQMVLELDSPVETLVEIEVEEEPIPEFTE
jgi:hypothetical protein